MILADFRVHGLPKAQGSLSPMRHRSTGKIVTFQSAKLLAWRKGVSLAARLHYRNPPYAGAVVLLLNFTLPKGKTVKRAFPTVPPDLDKIVRAVGDALSKIVFEDDAQVVDLVASKAYGEHPGVHVRVVALEVDAHD